MTGLRGETKSVSGGYLAACESSGVDILDHFADVGKMVSIGSGVDRKIEDFALSRYACYLVAQNGDPGKPEAMHLHSPGFKPWAM